MFIFAFWKRERFISVFQFIVKEFLVLKPENTARGIRHSDHVAPSIRKKLALTLPINSGRSIGIVRSRTQATEFLLREFIAIRMNYVNVLLIFTQLWKYM
jgi:hypothetical protein